MKKILAWCIVVPCVLFCAGLLIALWKYVLVVLVCLSVGVAIGWAFDEVTS